MQLMDKKDLIQYLDGKLTNNTLGRLVRAGSIPTVKFPGIRRYFFKKDEIDRWLLTLSLQSVGKVK